uniref:Uncharacterized protein n=1 Tax=uncultured marine virus TaxID=186617 RepID=A0A0F7L6I0_9VIRU|nr:hypothetical protein [uncultured marine virus]
MKKSISIAGFWFHIVFDGNNGIDQRGNEWINFENPEPKNKELINTCLDGFNLINYSNVRQLREQLIPDLDRNDFIEYVGGSDSKYLTEGNKYRLTCKPYRNRVCIINDGGKRMNTNVRYFKGA